MDLVPSSTAGGATLVGNTLSGATIVASSISGSTFVGGTISGSTILGATITGATIVGSTINSGSTVSPYAIAAQQYVSVHRNGVAQSITGSTFVKIQHTTEEFDASGVYDNATNYRMTPTVPGKYNVTGCLKFSAVSGGGVIVSSIYKNGVSFREERASTPGTDSGAIVTAVIDMNGTTDYLEHYVFQDAVAGGEDIDGSSTQTFFQAMWVSK